MIKNGKRNAWVIFTGYINSTIDIEHLIQLPVVIVTATPTLECLVKNGKENNFLQSK